MGLTSVCECAKVVQGALGEASCLNYCVDLSTQITHHTIPRVIHFCVSPRVRCAPMLGVYKRAVSHMYDFASLLYDVHVC